MKSPVCPVPLPLKVMDSCFDQMNGFVPVQM